MIYIKQLDFKGRIASLCRFQEQLSLRHGLQSLRQIAGGIQKNLQHLLICVFTITQRRKNTLMSPMDSTKYNAMFLQNAIFGHRPLQMVM